MEHIEWEIQNSFYAKDAEGILSTINNYWDYLGPSELSSAFSKLATLYKEDSSLRYGTLSFFMITIRIV